LSISSRPRSRRAKKTMIAYLVISVLSILIDRIYAQFGHGVYSAPMSLAFLYSLLGGALVFMLLWLFGPEDEDIWHSRLLFNLYNSGIAALMTGSLLKGVLDIAGTSSPYIIVYRLVGWLLLGIGILGFLGTAGKHTQYGR